MKNLIIATLILAAPCWISRAAEKTRSHPAWQTKAGEVLDVFTNAVVIRTFTIRTFELSPPSTALHSIEPADEAHVEATNSPAQSPTPPKLKPLPPNRPPRVFN